MKTLGQVHRVPLLGERARRCGVGVDASDMEVASALLGEGVEGTEGSSSWGCHRVNAVAKLDFELMVGL